MTENKEICENRINISIGNTVTTPRKKEIIYNPDMLINRSLALIALSSYIEEGWCLNKPIRCLDAFGATGIAGLSWAKAFPQVEVTINDPLEAACTAIKSHQDSNNLKVEITQQEIGSILLQRQFDFIYFDCYGSSVHYLDCLFKNVPKNAVVVITSTDDASLYGKAPNTTLRNYGGYVIKTFYAKELAARLVISSIVRAAARCNKGVEVLSSVAIKSHITVIIKVTRGPSIATQCVHKIQKVIHCCMCDNRAFYPPTVHPIERPYSFLSCDCRSKSQGKVAVDLGPVWTDSIFEPNFCFSMLNNSVKLEQSTKIRNLLQTILTESLGGRNAADFNLENKMEVDSEKEEESAVKKIKLDTKSLCPPFYFNLHRHSPKGYDLRKLSKIVLYLQQNGYQASRTHFDTEAVRTSATLPQFDSLMMKFSSETKQQIEIS